MVSVLPEPAPATTTSGRSAGADDDAGLLVRGRVGQPAAVGDLGGVEAPPGPLGRRRARHTRDLEGQLAGVDGPPCPRRHLVTCATRLVQRATATGRAPLAVGARAHLERARAHAVADLGQQLSCPGLRHRDVGGQRLLVLLLGLHAGAADLQQRGPARRRPVVGEGTGGHGHLVGGELAVLLDVPRPGSCRSSGRRRPAGPPRRARAGRPDRGPGRRPTTTSKSTSRRAAPGRFACVPAEEPAEHVLRRRAAAAGRTSPGRGQLVELGVQHRRRLGRRQPLGHLLGDGVHRRADRAGAVGRGLGAHRTRAPTAAGSAGRSRSPRGARAPASAGSTSGASSDSGGRPHHVAGSAPGTPSSASRRSRAAAAERRPAGVCGSVTARRSSATSAGRVSDRGSSVSGRPSSAGGGSTRSRNREAVAPASGAVEGALDGGDEQPAAGPGARDVEQPPLLGQRQRAAVDRRSRRSRRLARRGSSAPSSEVRSRRSGQTPSWTPATQTRSHSRPLAACAVSSRTVSPAEPGRHRCRRGAPEPTGARRTPATSADGSRSTKPAAASNSETTASRSRSATAPDGSTRGAGARPPAGQATALPHRPQHVLRGAAGRQRDAAGGHDGGHPECRPGHVLVRGRRAAPRRPARERGAPRGRRGRHPGRSARSGPPGAAGAGPAPWPRPAGRPAAPRPPARRARRSPPSGAGQHGAQGAAGTGPPPAAPPGAGRRRTPRPARRQCASARRKRAQRAGGAHDDGHVRPRQPVEQVGPAQHVGEVGGLDRCRGEDVHLGRTRRGGLSRRQPAVLPRTRQPLGHPPADPQQLLARPPADAERHPPGRASVGVPEALRELDDAARLRAAEGVDRLVGIADGDEVRRRDRPAARAAPPAPGRCPGTRRRTATAPARAPGASSSASPSSSAIAPRTSSAGSYPEASPRAAVEKAVTASYCSWKAAACTQCSWPELAPPARPAVRSRHRARWRAAAAPAARCGSRRCRGPAPAPPATGRRPAPRRRPGAARRPPRPARRRSAAAVAVRRAACAARRRTP